MGASAFTAAFGAISGIGIAAFANGLRNLPAFSRAFFRSLADLGLALDCLSVDAAARHARERPREG